MLCPLFIAREDALQSLVSASLSPSPLPLASHLDEKFILFSPKCWGRLQAEGRAWGGWRRAAGGWQWRRQTAGSWRGCWGCASVPWTAGNAGWDGRSCLRDKVIHECLRDSSGLLPLWFITSTEVARLSSHLLLACTHHMAFQSRCWGTTYCAFPALKNALLIAWWKWRWSTNGIFTVGLRASESYPTLPTRSLRGALPGPILGRPFPLVKTVWASDFFPTGTAQCCARSRSLPGRKVPVFVFPITGNCLV